MGKKGKKEKVNKEMQEEVVDTTNQTTEQTEECCAEAAAEQCTDQQVGADAEGTAPGDSQGDADSAADETKESAPKKDKKDEKIEELTDRLQRSMAEFDNYRKRTEKEKASMYVIGAKEIVEKILPVVDNFERALASTTEEQKADPFVEGMDKIYKHLCKTLEDMGVTAIEAVGKEFDPNLHNAVMHVDDENVGENIIVEEFQKGYTYHDAVVRHSMVAVTV